MQQSENRQLAAIKKVYSLKFMNFIRLYQNLSVFDKALLFASLR